MSRLMLVLATAAVGLSLVACNRTTAPLSCVDVKGVFNPAAPGFIVSFRSGVDANAATKALEAKYKFAATHIYTVLPGFSAPLSNVALSGVRCEPAVTMVEHDAVGSVASHSP